MAHHRMPVGQLWNMVLDAHLAYLNGAEIKTLCYILRHTIGFEKVSDSISLDQFLHGIQRRDGTRFNTGVGLSKKPLLAALRSLEERQILKVERRREPGKGHVASSYSIQLVKDRMKLAETLVPEEPVAADKCQKYTKPLGEKLPQVQGITVQGKIDHQAPLKISPPPVDICCPPSTPDDDSSKKRFRRRTNAKVTCCFTDEQLNLLKRMLSAGVSESQAHRVLMKANPERILQALEYLPYRNAKNPAGYFVNEVLSESFAVPKALQVDRQREVAKSRRRQEELESVARKEADQETYRAERQATYAALEPDQLRELTEEVRRRSRWARPEMLAEDSPVLQGMVLDLVAEGWLESRLGRRESKLNLPPPRGWAESRRGRLEVQEARA